MKKTFFNLKVLAVLTAGAVLVFGVYQAAAAKWVCDDIFITLRYIQNWFDGAGLVYNAGEYVEGYTHFLWLCLIALFQKLGINPIDSSEWMGIASYALLLSVFLLISSRLREKKEFYFPLTAIILALHYDFRIWVTGGLETSFFTMLIAAAFFTLFYLKIENNKRMIVTGSILTLALLTRPDAIIFFALTFLFVLIRDIVNIKGVRKIVQSALYLIAPALIIYIPYLIWKVSYYGDIFPNTYYAKMGFASYYSQGLFYLYTYFSTYISSLLFLSGFIFLIIAVKRSGGSLFSCIRGILLSSKTAPILLALAYIVVYSVFFIAKVGGDFMFARFVIPLIPFLYFAAEASLRELFLKKSRFLPPLYLFIILLLLVDHSRRNIPYSDGAATEKNETVIAKEFTLGWRGIVDEHWFYQRTNLSTGLDIIHSAEQTGLELRKYFAGQKVAVLIQGAQASLAYYSRFDYCIENLGLTDSYIAHLPLKERGRPGHERKAPYDYLISKNIDFMFGSFPDEYSDFQYIEFKMPSRFYQGTIITYNRDLMRHLKAEFPTQILFIDFEKYLDDYIKKMSSFTPNQIKSDYEKFCDFYFSRNSDPERESYFLNGAAR